jgi:hypothetical protein
LLTTAETMPEFAAMSASLANRKAPRLSRLSLGLGLAALAIAGLFTLTAAGAILSGNAAFLEDSRSLNRAYLFLSLAGEALALAGIVMGAAALFVGRRLAGGLLAALALNLVMALLFLPATLAALLNALFAVLERMGR